MIKQRYKEEVMDFLKHYPSPSIRTATTMYNGCVVCIAPVRGICGAEVMCSPQTRESLVRLIREVS